MSHVDEAESIVRKLAEDLTQPQAGECLCCFVDRQLILAPCDGTHRHSLRYRDAAAPRATRLVERVSRLGACCCDCELFLNGYALRSAYGPEGVNIEDDSPQVPPCAGVRRGSVQPCSNWVRQRWYR